MLSIEGTFQIIELIEYATEKDAPKTEPEPLRPPLVDVVDWPMNLFPPTLALTNPREEFERKQICFNQSPVSHLLLHHRLRLQLVRIPRFAWKRGQYSHL